MTETSLPSDGDETQTLTDAPWEPPLAGTETEHLFGALDRLRWTFRWKVDGLDAAGLDQRLGPETLTLGGLLKHLAVQEDYAATHKLTGAPMPAAWEGHGWEEDQDWEFTSASHDSPDTLYATYDAAVARSRAAWAAYGDLDGRAAVSEQVGRPVSARRVLCDLLEEYGRHTGHADLLREGVDGRVGEDPDAEWRPVPGW